MFGKLIETNKPIIDMLKRGDTVESLSNEDLLEALDYQGLTPSAYTFLEDEMLRRVSRQNVEESL
jgi:hypothetical protein